MALRCALLMALVLSFGACDSCGGGGESNRGSPASKAQVAAPDGLVLELMVPHPGATVASLRQAAGGPALFLPRTLGGMIQNLFGLPLRMAEQIDEDLPMVGAAAAVGSGKDAPLSMAIAVHVKSGARFVQQMTTGADGTFSAEVDGELTWLLAKPAAREARIALALAVIDNYLVFGPDRGAVTRLAPYLARTLVVRKPAVLLKQGALIEVIAADRLRPLVNRVTDAVSGLQLPKMVRPLIDLPAATDMARSIIADVGPGRIVLNIDEHKIRVSGELAPRDAAAAKRFAAFPSVEPAHLLELPEDTVAALSWGEDLEGRKDRAAARAEPLEPLLGEGWSKKDRKRIVAALGKLALGRGDKTVLGLRCSGVGLTGLAHGDVSDAATLREGLESLTGLHERKPMQKKLDDEQLSLSVEKTRILLVPHDVWRLRLSPIAKQPSKKAAAKKDKATDADAGAVIDLLYAVSDERFMAVAGMDTILTMQRLHKPDPERSLSTKKSMKEAVDRLGKRVWLVALLDPQGMHACRQGMPGGRFSTPVTLSAGFYEGKLRGGLELARPLLKLLLGELGL
jgi:hypothetical protein